MRRWWALRSPTVCCPPCAPRRAPIETYEASVAFIDVFGFRAVLAAHPPEVVFGYLNLPLSALHRRGLGSSGSRRASSATRSRRSSAVTGTRRGRWMLVSRSASGSAISRVGPPLRATSRTEPRWESRSATSWPVRGALSLGRLEPVVLGEPARTAAELQSAARDAR